MNDAPLFLFNRIKKYFLYLFIISYFILIPVIILVIINESLNIRDLTLKSQSKLYVRIWCKISEKSKVNALPHNNGGTELSAMTNYRSGTKDGGSSMGIFFQYERTKKTNGYL